MKTHEDKIKKNKTEIINSIQKRSLKIVLHRNENFPINSAKTKSKLIQELLSKEKQKLKVDQRNTSDLSDDIEITEKIKQLVEQKKADIFICDIESKSEPIGLPPPQVLQAIKDKKKQRKNENLAFPSIPKHKITRFFNLLSSKERVSQYEKDLKFCVPHLQSSFKPHWSAPSCILKAIHHSILHRKWSNVTELLLMILHLPLRRYAPLVRYICQFMARLHPLIQERNLRDQFTVIEQLYRRS